MPLKRIKYETVGSTTLVVPAGIKHIVAHGCGGGGSGAGGTSGNSATGQRANGGGGGGSGPRGRAALDVVPGETLTIAISAAPAGGGAGGGNGTAGGNTTITGSTSGLLATFVGGAPGRNDNGGSYGGGTPGGPYGNFIDSPHQSLPGVGGLSIGSGGYGGNANSVVFNRGSQSVTQSAAGIFRTLGGAIGTFDVGSKQAGMGGGGGAPSCYGEAGGVGGAGSSGSAGAGIAASPGNAGTNGGGGGGGGGGGQFLTGSSLGGAGGAGSGGVAFLEWME